ncbi:unnamed protein product [Caenorhabditis sp. 36 PRJEB53466]|nr:unnamed protein product [Caenorhabditis sp. 36 PRJEB53466]
MKAMSMEQKYREADNIVTFYHHLNFTIGHKDPRVKGVFATVFESSLLDWDIIMHKQFGGHSLATRTSNWQISLNGTGSRDIYPPVHRIFFTVNVLDGEENITTTLKYFINGRHVQVTQARSRTHRNRQNDNKIYETEANSQFGRQLAHAMDEVRGKDLVVQLVTRMEFRKNELTDVNFLVGEGAPEVTDMNAFYFDALTNKSRHDLKLKTSNGSQFVMTNKEIVCLASSYFRQHLKEHSTEHTVSRADSLESIEIALIYLVTGRYKKPAQLPPRLAKEVYDLGIQWKVFEMKALKNSIEKHCCEELSTNRDDFLYVCNLLIAAEDAQFMGVLNACIATLLFYHFPVFVRTFISGNHPLKERLSQRREFHRPSLVMQVKRGFAASQDIRRFVKYLPELGQD